MTPADIHNILNIIGRFNKSIDLGHWESLQRALQDDLSIQFPGSSLSDQRPMKSFEFVNYLKTQLSGLKSQHRDYNFYVTGEEEVVCKSDFRIEVFSQDDKLISGASGTHYYSMNQENGRWQIASIKRKILRLEKAESV